MTSLDRVRVVNDSSNTIGEKFEWVETHDDGEIVILVKAVTNGYSF